MTRRRGARAASVVGAAALGVALLAGCGTGPETIGPTGVDELVVPSPSPDPADFVADVDNAWWPLVGGSSATYDDGTGRLLRRTVATAPERVGGVQAVAVRTEAVAATWGADALPVPVTEWFAQDRRRNVWIVGGTLADGSRWEAGVDGAAAGLVVTGTPRTGDGYVRRAAPGLADVRVRVLAVGETTTVGGDEVEVARLEVTTVGASEAAAEAEAAEGGRPSAGRTRATQVGEEVLARGVGPVTLTGPQGDWVLVAP
ncbi:MAG: hypothetical protein PIR53_08475 [Nocardioides alkalitolerans]